MNDIKLSVCSLCGVIGGFIAHAFGGWTADMVTLVTFMAIDYITGLMVAAVFRKSPKTESGGVNSSIGWKGICKKFMILVIVFVAYRFDITLGVEYIKTATIIAFIVNEAISITENAGLMGIPLPDAVKKAIDILRKKDDENDDKNVSNSSSK